MRKVRFRLLPARFAEKQQTCCCRKRVAVEKAGKILCILLSKTKEASIKAQRIPHSAKAPYVPRGFCRYSSACVIWSKTLTGPKMARRRIDKQQTSLIQMRGHRTGRSVYRTKGKGKRVSIINSSTLYRSSIVP